MERELAEEVLACLPGGESVFRYFKDRYALQLLAYAASGERSFAHVRRGRFRPLLKKPTVRLALTGRGGRGVDWELLDSYFPSGTEDFSLTLSLWGDVQYWQWDQMTRPGFNVVVQLNFPRAHDRAYRRLVQPGQEHPWEWEAHPIHRHRRTLAWARLDLDLEHGEALVEEIQSDWVREARRAGEQALASLIDGTLARPSRAGRSGCDALQLFRYVEHVLEPHRRMWDQAVLAASLWLLRERLGLRRVYMHTFETGMLLKNMAGWAPPRSPYEEVPRSFCFERVSEPPRFLRSWLARRWPRSRHEFWLLRL